MSSALHKALLPIARRLRRQRMLRFVSFGFLAGALSGLLLVAASFLWPLENAVFYGMGAILAGGLEGLLVGGLWPVSPMNAAKSADCLGLMARAQTALEWEKEPETPMSALQRADFLRAVDRFPLETIPLRPHKASMLTAVGCAVLAGCLLLLPNPQSDVLRARNDFRQEMKKQADHVDAGAKELEKQDKETAKEARKLLGELANHLREADEPREALEAIDQTAQKLEKLKQNQGSALGQALRKSGLGALAEAMEAEGEAAIRKAMEEQSPETLAKSLMEAAQDAGDASSALESAAAALEGGDFSQAAQALMDAGAASAAGISQASALLQMAQLSAASAGQCMGTASPGTMPQSLAALGALAGQGQGAGSGAGGGGGIGQGAGGGAGQGSTNKDAGFSSGANRSSGSGALPPEEKIGEYEAIYDPTRIGAEGELAQEKGRVGEGDTSEITLSGGTGDLGGLVPYAEVAEEYQESAVRSVENANLPSYVQKWVETYFQSLLD